MWDAQQLYVQPTGTYPFKTAVGAPEPSDNGPRALQDPGTVEPRGNVLHPSLPQYYQPGGYNWMYLIFVSM